MQLPLGANVDPIVTAPEAEAGTARASATANGPSTPKRRLITTVSPLPSGSRQPYPEQARPVKRSRRLLRQPGGFEGLGFLMVEVHLDSPGEFLFVDGQDLPVRELGLDAAPRAPDRRGCVDQNLVSVETDLLQVDHLRLEGVRLQPGAIIRRSPDRRLVTGREKLDFGMDEFHQRVEIAPAVGLVATPHPGGDLVLLRHR